MTRAPPRSFARGHARGSWACSELSQTRMNLVNTPVAVDSSRHRADREHFAAVGPGCARELAQTNARLASRR